MSDSEPTPSDLQELLARFTEGPGSTRELMELAYRELHQMAERLMKQEGSGHTLQPTALVNEAFLRLVGSKNLGSKGHEGFLAAAAVAMRRILIDHARRGAAEKRGGEWQRVTLTSLVDQENEELDILDLNRALERLEGLDSRQAKVVELRFFSGMSGEQIASHLGISRNTVVRELTMARAWLRHELQKTDE
jgi:RNA polymerase sigma factor (TIGR02999 family)